MQEPAQVKEIKRSAPKNFILDASILDMEETIQAIREDVKRNRVEYIFPDGLNEIDILDEVRALVSLDDFDTLYDTTMRLLEGRPVVMNLINLDNSRTNLCTFQVTNRNMNLRAIDMISEYPCLVLWLTEFMAAYLAKKFPQPTKNLPQAQAAKKNSGNKANRAV